MICIIRAATGNQLVRRRRYAKRKTKSDIPKQHMRNMIRNSVVTLLASVSFVSTLQGGTPAENLMKKPDVWFSSDDGRNTLDNILSWQSQHGDWPKNKDTTSEKYSGDRGKLQGTFDNDATLGELRVLAKAFRITGGEQYKTAVLLGFDHVLAAQYSNGGWPQYFPLSKSYHRQITFNDGSMIRVVEFLRDSGTHEDFAFIGTERHAAAASAIDRGIDCIIKCQVVIGGQPTVWCAQHDEVTLAPANARAYELASLSGAESAGILKFLMSLESPNPDVIKAVNAGMSWFKTVQINGYRYNRSGTEPSLTADSSARPLWARFYEIGTNRPMFCDRDGVVKYDVEEIGSERRGGYMWYGNWGDSLAKTYEKWPHRAELSR
jgi:PelA/Pel-15E family pectate lyase